MLCLNPFSLIDIKISTHPEDSEWLHTSVISQRGKIPSRKTVSIVPPHTISKQTSITIGPNNNLQQKHHREQRLAAQFHQ
jgi:hypothetical protein